MAKYDKSTNAKTSFANAFNGLFWAFHNQINFKRHLIALILVVIVGFLLQISHYEWLLVITVIYSVIVVELINTSLEQTTDAITQEYHPKIKKAKDIAAAAVLAYAIYALTIGLLIFGPKILALISS